MNLLLPACYASLFIFASIIRERSLGVAVRWLDWLFSSPAHSVQELSEHIVKFITEFDL